MALFGSSKTTMVKPEDALAGRATSLWGPAPVHAVLGTPLQPPFPAGIEAFYLGAGCFWGVEEIFWRMPGVYTTSVGYMGGFTPNPTYEEVCTARTGHTEATMVAYDPAMIDVNTILREFWENHDPTQVNRQGNDIGTQYRSAIFWTTPQQHEAAIATRDAFQSVLDERGYGQITTQIAAAEGLMYFEAEDYHQQYLYKNPNGYRCHASTGLRLPV
jgi:peptide-methionine (S)-S-oxide reductase